MEPVNTGAPDCCSSPCYCSLCIQSAFATVATKDSWSGKSRSLHVFHTRSGLCNRVAITIKTCAIRQSSQARAHTTDFHTGGTLQERQSPELFLAPMLASSTSKVRSSPRPLLCASVLASPAPVISIYGLGRWPSLSIPHIWVLATL